MLSTRNASQASVNPKNTPCFGLSRRRFTALTFASPHGTHDHHVALSNPNVLQAPFQNEVMLMDLCNTVMVMTYAGWFEYLTDKLVVLEIQKRQAVQQHQLLRQLAWAMVGDGGRGGAGPGGAEREGEKPREGRKRSRKTKARRNAYQPRPGSVKEAQHCPCPWTQTSKHGAQSMTEGEKRHQRGGTKDKGARQTKATRAP